MKKEEYDRIEKMNALIVSRYDLHPDEVDRRCAGYPATITEMIEVVEVCPRGCTFMDLFEDREYKPVMVPKGLAAFLRPHDVFLTTLGFRNGKWNIIWLTPAYEKCDFGENMEIGGSEI